MPQVDVIREHLAEAATYEGPAQSELGARSSDLGASTPPSGAPRKPQGPTAYQREVARLEARRLDTTPQVRLYRFRRKKGCEAAAETVRMLPAKPQVEVRQEEAEGCWHLRVHWRADFDASKLNRQIKGSGGQQISHHEADEQLSRALELLEGAGSPALLGITKPVASPGSRRPARMPKRR